MIILNNEENSAKNKTIVAIIKIRFLSSKVEITKNLFKVFLIIRGRSSPFNTFKNGIIRTTVNNSNNAPTEIKKNNNKS